MLNINGAQTLFTGERFGGLAISLSTTAMCTNQLAKTSVVSSPAGFTVAGGFSLPAKYWSSPTVPTPWIEPPTKYGQLGCYPTITSGYGGTGLSGTGTITRAAFNVYTRLTGHGSLSVSISGGLATNFSGSGQIINVTLGATPVGFSSIDDIITKITAVSLQTDDVWFQKVLANSATTTVYNWYEFLSASGVPSAINLINYQAPGVATALTSSTPGALPLIEGNVNPLLRSLMNIEAWFAGNSGVCNLILCDFLLYYPSLRAYSVDQTPLTNTVPLPYYADGKGVKAIAIIQTALSVRGDLIINFVADDGTAQSSTITAPSDFTNVTGMFTQYVSNGLSKNTPFLPIPNGKTGIRSITSYAFATGGNGTIAILLCKPIVQIPLGPLGQNTASMRDCLYQLQSLPQIRDGACLGIIANFPNTIAAPAQPISGRIQYGWA